MYMYTYYMYSLCKCSTAPPPSCIFVYFFQFRISNTYFTLSTVFSKFITYVELIPKIRRDVVSPTVYFPVCLHPPDNFRFEYESSKLYSSFYHFVNTTTIAQLQVFLFHR